MKNYTLLLLMLLAVMATSCDKDDDDDNNNNTNPPPVNEVDLANLSVAEGALEATGDTAFFWRYTTMYDYSTTLTSSGTTYDRWEIVMPGPNPGEELDIKILQIDSDPDANQRVIPEDDTYILGGSMDENDVTVDISSDFYTFRNSSVGSLTLTKDGEIWNIELSAEGLRAGSFGEEDKIIDIDAALKAIPE